ncbi:TPA: hypothetical protein KRL47_001309 [Clostridioides difficile]|nr:hypothetical protein [Clostridioides difficile]
MIIEIQNNNLEKIKEFMDKENISYNLEKNISDFFLKEEALYILEMNYLHIYEDKINLDKILNIILKEINFNDIQTTIEENILNCITRINCITSYI